ncbi:carboxypeptidase-like regulatory domain-containing protein [Bacteroides sp. BFG-551]|nr:carboxypeptidase-like regulatory domain-containing protein [Bacteroides sp. BFG-551]
MMLLPVKAIRGTVLDEANDPIIGASVLVKGTTNGSITGVDGTFNVKANPSDVLVVSYVGYATVEQSVGNRDTACNTPARRL